MNNHKLLSALISSVIVIAFILGILFFRAILDFIVDLWWFKSLNFEGYFWLKTLYRFIFSGIVTAFFSAAFLLHFWIASRYLDSNALNTNFSSSLKINGNNRLSGIFISYYNKFYIITSLLLGIIIALPFYTEWERALLFFFGGPSGHTDPIFGNDVSFYLFHYPIYLLIQKQLLISTAAALAIISAVYSREYIFTTSRDVKLSLGAKIHLCVVFGFLSAFVIWGSMLKRYSILYADANEPVFFGPGFIELRYDLPLIWLSVFALLSIAASLIFYLFSEKHRSKVPSIAALVFFMTVTWLRHFDAIPHLIDKVIVEPNFSRIESDAMRDNIEATLDAYRLSYIKTIDYKINPDALPSIRAWSSEKHLDNIPIWDRELLEDSYRQLQGIRPYYDFPAVDEDRYFINGNYQQVNIAGREIDIEKLPKEAQNWENTHLRYTHGYGAAISPAAQNAGEPMTWYMRDLNLYSSANFSVKYPDIYYGLEKYRYAIAPNILPTAEISGTQAPFSAEYHGQSGIPLSSYFNKILTATYLQDEKIFLSPNITEDSKLLLRRNIVERIGTVTPFLHLDSDPYLVIGKDRFYWIVDAYTISDYYPLSKPTDWSELNGNHQFNYIRNSVKIVVDAYDGDLDYYISDPDDPIIEAYNRAYPGAFRNLSEMPPELREHLRYPRDLYRVQMRTYAKYHQDSPELFYEQAETWQYASQDGSELLPYFITINLGRCDNRDEFAMISPMSPIHRENLSMIGVASILDEESCDQSYKPNITVFKFPKAVQVNGPSQVGALIDQNPEIAAQFYLWNQQGAEIIKGRMVILPMLDSILYIQPIYMRAKQTKIPELARVIVSTGNQVVMDKTLSLVFERLQGLIIKAPNRSN